MDEIKVECRMCWNWSDNPTQRRVGDGPNQPKVTNRHQLYLKMPSASDPKMFHPVHRRLRFRVLDSNPTKRRFPMADIMLFISLFLALGYAWTLIEDFVPWTGLLCWSPDLAWG